MTQERTYKSGPSDVEETSETSACAKIELSNIPISILDREDYEWYLPCLRHLFYSTKPCYLVTFASYNEPYKRNPAWYTNKMLDSLKKKIGKVSFAFYARESYETEKTHCHALISTDQDLMKLHRKPVLSKRGYLDIERITDTDADKKTVFNYITKECLIYEWHKYEHYAHTHLPEYCQNIINR